MNNRMPFLISITAIAAKSKLIIFDSAFVPASPNTFINQYEPPKIRPAKRMFPITAIMVGSKPYSEIITS